MCGIQNNNKCHLVLAALSDLTVLVAWVLGTSSGCLSQVGPISSSNWGLVTAPVFGIMEGKPYAGAELFAGPHKFGDDYFRGVLPDGRIVRPAGKSAQVGMNPEGSTLTPDGRFLITSNDDERDSGLESLVNPTNVGGYSISVVDTRTLKVVSQIASGPVYIGLQVTGSGPYTLWASGGPSNSIKLFSISEAGIIAPTIPDQIAIPPITPSTAGFVSNYTPGPALNTTDAHGNKPAVPTGFNRRRGAHITFPAGSALSANDKYLYVACNGDNSLAVIDTIRRQVVRQIPVGYFPYGVAVSRDGTRVLVSNWGMTGYKFAHPSYKDGKLTAIGATAANYPDGFYVPVTSTRGRNPKTSSVSVVLVPDGNGARARLIRSIYLGKPLDALSQVGDTHPSASAVVRSNGREVLYVCKTNSDAIGIIPLDHSTESDDTNETQTFDLSPVKVSRGGGFMVHGAYPDAIAVLSDGRRTYVAEAGINSVAVLNTELPTHPVLLGRIPTGWYPTSLAVSPNGHVLYIINAKGVGEDINPRTLVTVSANQTGVESFADSNYIFGTVQKVDLGTIPLNDKTVLANNFAILRSADASVVPIGGAASRKIKHVIFILHENKTFDSELGNLTKHFGPYASTSFNQSNGVATRNQQFTGVSLNVQLLARTFGAAVNYYSDSEESDAGHQFCASGTASDYTERTLLVKKGRGLLVDKNFEPEDYPEAGYIFNNAARHGVSFKDYGDMVRIAGTDTGSSTPTSMNDGLSGLVGYPQLDPNGLNVTSPLIDRGDVTSHTRGLGQSYFLALPVLAVLGGSNKNGVPRVDVNYPGYNFNISDQRRALEFCSDFDRMLKNGTVPQFLYIYQPNDHTGAVKAPNRAETGSSPAQQVADGDVALGMVVRHIMDSPIYYNPRTGEGCAIFITWDDAQSTRDHIHPHRTPLIVIGPYVKPGYIGKRHYSTASVVKTEELLLGLAPNNLGDLFATDLRDFFQPGFNGIIGSNLAFTRSVNYKPSPEGEKIWALVSRLDTSGPDRDSRRLGALTRLSMEADRIHLVAKNGHWMHTATYLRQQTQLYQDAVQVVSPTSSVSAIVCQSLRMDRFLLAIWGHCIGFLESAKYNHQRRSVGYMLRKTL